MKKFLRSPVVTGLMFLVAIALLVTGSFGTTQAALQYRSQDHESTYVLKHIGVALLENGGQIAHRTYGDKAESGFTDVQNGSIVLNNLQSENDPEPDKQVKIGKKYPCIIQAENTGSIDQYVRVIIRKYWVKTASNPGGQGYFKTDGKIVNGEKEADPAVISFTKITDDIYNPDYILLTADKGDNRNTYNTTNWYKDESFSQECDVYYYKGILKEKETTESLFNYLAISNEISKYKMVNVTTEGSTTTYTYAFDGYGFVIEAEVDAIQTHHARAAMISAWGTSADVMNKIGIPTE